MADYRVIKLWNTDKVAIVSECDYERINKHHWSLSKRGYAVMYNPANKKKVFMHRMVMNAEYGKIIDHKNCDPLDNRRENLRYATKSQNRMNCPSTNSHRGVSYHRQSGKWQAYIKKDGKQYALGMYINLEDAVAARKEAEEKYYGEYRYMG